MGRGGQREFGQAFEQGLKGNQHFKPCQGRADAEMDSGTEADMGIGFTHGVKLIWIRKSRGVAVGGTQHQAHFFTLFEFDPGIFNVFQRVTREQVKRRVKAQDFFDERFRDGFRSEERRVGKECRL